jgi:hypothetical protein
MPGNALKQVSGVIEIFILGCGKQSAPPRKRAMVEIKRGTSGEDSYDPNNQ